MAENLTQYAHGREFLDLLQQQLLPKDIVHQLADKVAQIIEEALQAGPQTQHNGLSRSAKPEKQQTGIRDMQQADAVLQGLSLIIPRGKFDVAFYPDCLQTLNKQTSAVVPYSSIQHILVIDAIPKQPTTTNVVLVMKSGCPVAQGKNLLDLVVIQTKDQPELRIAASKACQHLGDELCGAAAVVLSQLLASYLPDITEDTFLTADSSIFSSSAGHLMVEANQGASAGWLVPLSAGLCYIGKPGRFISSSSIRKVIFHRAGGGSSTFDITIKMVTAAAAGSSGSSSSKDFELGQIDAAEVVPLQNYLSSRRIRVGTEDEDEDEEDVGSAAAGAAGVAGGNDDDDEDEEDDDYNPEVTEEPASKRRRSGNAMGAAGGSGSDASASAAAAAGGKGCRVARVVELLDDDDDDDADEDEDDDDDDDGSEESDDEDSDDVSLVDENAMMDHDDDDEEEEEDD